MPRELFMLPAQTTGLEARLAALTTTGALTEQTRDGRLRCNACAHRCTLRDGDPGLCGVRYRRGGELRVPWGYVAARRVMPIERNTIYHVRPGSLGLTFGMLGCDLRCPWCSNWTLSQALRDGRQATPVVEITAGALVAEAIEADCRIVVSAFNEPMNTAEWAHAIFSEARRHDLLTALVSDGNTTPAVMRSWSGGGTMSPKPWPSGRAAARVAARRCRDSGTGPDPGRASP
jgi:pyruvate formate lyase activating enzyme